MSAPLLAVVGLIYLAVAVDYYLAGNRGMTIVFVGYALANVGLIMAPK